MRAGFFVSLPFYDENVFSSVVFYPIFAIFADLPSLLYFSTFTLLILFYGEITIQASRQNPSSISRLRTTFVVINILVYVMQLIIWLLVPTFGNTDENVRLFLTFVRGPNLFRNALD